MLSLYTKNIKMKFLKTKMKKNDPKLFKFSQKIRIDLHFLKAIGADFKVSHVK
jgi:hypothetical protein